MVPFSVNSKEHLSWVFVFFFMGCIKEDFTRLKVNCHSCFFDFSKEMLNSLKNTSFEKLFLGKAPQIMIIPAVSDERK